jgi:hypothetical protein
VATWLTIALFLGASALSGRQLWRAWKYSKIYDRYAGEVIRAQRPAYFWLVVGIYVALFAASTYFAGLIAVRTISGISN